MAASRYDPTRLYSDIEEVLDLAKIEPGMANTITIHLDHNFDTEKFFSELLSFKPDKRPGDLFIDIYNPETRQVLTVHSRRKFPITKELVDFLSDWGVKFRITTV